MVISNVVKVLDFTFMFYHLNSSSKYSDYFKLKEND